MRTENVTVKLSAEEYEWLRRKAHWEGKPMAALLRDHLVDLANTKIPGRVKLSASS